MKLESKKYLFDIMTAAEKVQKFVSGKSYETYRNDDMLKSAVERQFEIIGEALNSLIKIEETMKQVFPDARDIISFRNLLIHGYDGIDDRLVWSITQTRIIGLIEKTKELLK